MKCKICLLLLLFTFSLYSMELYPVLKTTTGKEYKRVKVVSVKPDGLKVIHSRGAGIILFKNLSVKIQEKYGYDAEKAEKYSKQKSAAKAKIKEAARLALEIKTKLQAARIKAIKERKDEALAKKKELLKSLYKEGIPCICATKVIMKRVDTGRTIMIPKKTLIIQLGEYYFYRTVLLFKPIPAPTKAEQFIQILSEKLGEVETIIQNNESVVAQKEGAIKILVKERMDLLENERKELQKEADRVAERDDDKDDDSTTKRFVASDPAISVKSNEIRELKKEIRKIEMKNRKHQKVFIVLGKEKVAMEKILTKFQKAKEKELNK